MNRENDSRWDNRVLIEKVLLFIVIEGGWLFIGCIVMLRLYIGKELWIGIDGWGLL